MIIIIFIIIILVFVIGFCKSVAYSGESMTYGRGHTIPEDYYQPNYNHKDPKQGLELYVDGNGYYRFKSNDRLLHRDIAFIYLYKKCKYYRKIPFRSLQVHHIDQNKLNNSLDNLLILTEKEHHDIHFDDEGKFKTIHKPVIHPTDQYLDKNGYLRYKSNKGLVHRDLAFRYIYKKTQFYQRNIRFQDLIVYHIDKNKINNSLDNLRIGLKNHRNLN